MTVLKSKSDQSAGHTYYQWLITLICNIITISVGLQMGWVSPNIRHLTSSTSPTGSPVSDSTLGWIASANSIGSIIAIPIFTFVIDRYGRKIGLISVTVPQAICWILKLTSSSAIGLIIARVFCGIAGTCLLIVGVYIKEISKDTMRGTLQATCTVSMNLGILIMYALGGYLDYYTTIWIVFWIPVLAIILLIKVPESPDFLVKKGKLAEALSTLAWLRGLPENDEAVQAEYQALQKEVFSSATTEMPSVSFIEVAKNPVWRKGFILMAAIVFVQANSGQGVIVNFALPLLELAGVTANPTLQSLSVPAVTIIGSMVSLAAIEKSGRKSLMVMSVSLGAVSLCCLAICLLVVDPESSATNWLPVLFLVLYMFAYSAGLMPLPAIIAAEMFNVQIRAKLMSTIIIFSWVMTFIQLNLYASTGLDPSTSFFIFAAINFLGIFLIVTFLPETKGKNVEEIENLLRKPTALSFK